ncbi:MAG TPA: hypothetical protein VGC66_09825 [Pyrinomonadaceae bacterium]
MCKKEIGARRLPGGLFERIAGRSTVQENPDDRKNAADSLQA